MKDETICIEKKRVDRFLKMLQTGAIYEFLPPLAVNDSRLIEGNTTSCYFYFGAYLGFEGDQLVFQESSPCGTCQAKFVIFLDEHVTLRLVVGSSNDDIIA